MCSLPHIAFLIGGILSILDTYLKLCIIIRYACQETPRVRGTKNKMLICYSLCHVKWHDTNLSKVTVDKHEHFPTDLKMKHQLDAFQTDNNSPEMYNVIHIKVL